MPLQAQVVLAIPCQQPPGIRRASLGEGPRSPQAQCTQQQMVEQFIGITRELPEMDGDIQGPSLQTLDRQTLQPDGVPVPIGAMKFPAQGTQERALMSLR